MDEMIRVRGLTRHYGELVAVDHIDFEVHRGEIFGFLGPNGAGKTTTIRMLTGVIDPTEGSASIDGHDIRTKAIAARRHLGILPEDANVYVDLTVWQNVMLMGESSWRRSASKTAEPKRDARSPRGCGSG